MKKVCIIYQSHGGNVEVLANEIYEGAKKCRSRCFNKTCF